MDTMISSAAIPSPLIPIIIDVALKHIEDAKYSSKEYIIKNAATIAFIIRYLIDTEDVSRLESWARVIPKSVLSFVIDREFAASSSLAREALFGCGGSIIKATLEGDYEKLRVLINILPSSGVVDIAFTYRDIEVLKICRDSDKYRFDLMKTVLEEIRDCRGTSFSRGIRDLADEVIIAAIDPAWLVDTTDKYSRRRKFVAFLLKKGSGVLLDHFVASSTDRKEMQAIISRIISKPKNPPYETWSGCLYLTQRGYSMTDDVNAMIVSNGYGDILATTRHAPKYRARLVHLKKMMQKNSTRRLMKAIEKVEVHKDSTVSIYDIHVAYKRTRIRRCLGLSDVVIRTIRD